MMKRSLLLLVAVIGLGVTVQPREARAVAVAQPCSTPGGTAMSDDQRDLMACLYDGAHSLAWKQVTDTPAPNSDAALAARATARMADARSRWQGWYAGGNVGYAETTDSYVTNGTAFGGAEYMPGGPVDHTIDGSTVGLVGGYNHVTSNGLFYGGEADLNYMSNGGNMPNVFTPYDSFGGSEITADLKSQWTGYATARGRLGVAFDPALIYLTGGLALADVKDTFSTIPFGGSNFFESSRILPGWTVGAGAEFALTDNISLSAQYLRLQMAAHYVTMIDYDSSGKPVKFRLDDSADILRVGVNWHFD